MTTAENRGAFEPRVEDDRLPTRKVWLAGAIAMIVVVLSILVASAILRASSRSAVSGPPPRTAGEQIGIVEQTLILHARRGLDKNAAGEESLRHFGWADRAHGVARIPIDRAMDLVTDRAFMRAFETEAHPSADANTRGGK